MRQNPSQRILVKTAVLLLLFAVVGLATSAKRGKYLPKANPLHLFAKAAKMNLLHPPVDMVPAPAHPVSRVVPSQPEFSATPLAESKRLTLCQIGLAISFRHRAPPSFSA